MVHAAEQPSLVAVQQGLAKLQPATLSVTGRYWRKVADKDQRLAQRGREIQFRTPRTSASRRADSAALKRLMAHPNCCIDESLPQVDVGVLDARTTSPTVARTALLSAKAIAIWSSPCDLSQRYARLRPAQHTGQWLSRSRILRGKPRAKANRGLGRIPTSSGERHRSVSY